MNEELVNRPEKDFDSQLECDIETACVKMAERGQNDDEVDSESDYRDSDDASSSEDEGEMEFLTREEYKECRKARPSSLETIQEEDEVEDFEWENIDEETDNESIDYDADVFVSTDDVIESPGNDSSTLMMDKNFTDEICQKQYPQDILSQQRTPSENENKQEVILQENKENENLESNIDLQDVLLLEGVLYEASTQAAIAQSIEAERNEKIDLNCKDGGEYTTGPDLISDTTENNTEICPEASNQSIGTVLSVNLDPENVPLNSESQKMELDCSKSNSHDKNAVLSDNTLPRGLDKQSDKTGLTHKDTPLCTQHLELRNSMETYDHEKMDTSKSLEEKSEKKQEDDGENSNLCQENANDTCKTQAVTSQGINQDLDLEKESSRLSESFDKSQQDSTGSEEVEMSNDEDKKSTQMRKKNEENDNLPKASGENVKDELGRESELAVDNHQNKISGEKIESNDHNSNDCKSEVINTESSEGVFNTENLDQSVEEVNEKQTASPFCEQKVNVITAKQFEAESNQNSLDMEPLSTNRTQMEGESLGSDENAAETSPSTQGETGMEAARPETGVEDSFSSMEISSSHFISDTEEMSQSEFENIVNHNISDPGLMEAMDVNGANSDAILSDTNIINLEDSYENVVPNLTQHDNVEDIVIEKHENQRPCVQDDNSTNLMSEKNAECTEQAISSDNVMEQGDSKAVASSGNEILDKSELIGKGSNTKSSENLPQFTDYEADVAVTSQFDSEEKGIKSFVATFVEDLFNSAFDSIPANINCDESQEKSFPSDVVNFEEKSLEVENVSENLNQEKYLTENYKMDAEGMAESLDGKKLEILTEELNQSDTQDTSDQQTKDSNDDPGFEMVGYNSDDSMEEWKEIETDLPRNIEREAEETVNENNDVDVEGVNKGTEIQQTTGHPELEVESVDVMSKVICEEQNTILDDCKDMKSKVESCDEEMKLQHKESTKQTLEVSQDGGPLPSCTDKTKAECNDGKMDDLVGKHSGGSQALESENLTSLNTVEKVKDSQCSDLSPTGMDSNLLNITGTNVLEIKSNNHKTDVIETNVDTEKTHDIVFPDDISTSVDVENDAFGEISELAGSQTDGAKLLNTKEQQLEDGSNVVDPNNANLILPTENIYSKVEVSESEERLSSQQEYTATQSYIKTSESGENEDGLEALSGAVGVGDKPEVSDGLSEPLDKQDNNGLSEDVIENTREEEVSQEEQEISVDDVIRPESDVDGNNLSACLQTQDEQISASSSVDDIGEKTVISNFDEEKTYKSFIDEELYVEIDSNWSEAQEASAKGKLKLLTPVIEDNAENSENTEGKEVKSDQNKDQKTQNESTGELTGEFSKLNEGCDNKTSTEDSTKNDECDQSKVTQTQESQDFVGGKPLNVKELQCLHEPSSSLVDYQHLETLNDLSTQIVGHVLQESLKEIEQKYNNESSPDLDSKINISNMESTPSTEEFVKGDTVTEDAQVSNDPTGLDSTLLAQDSDTPIPQVDIDEFHFEDVTKVDQSHDLEQNITTVISESQKESNTGLDDSLLSPDPSIVLTESTQSQHGSPSEGTPVLEEHFVYSVSESVSQDPLQCSSGLDLKENIIVSEPDPIHSLSGELQPEGKEPEKINDPIFDKVSSVEENLKENPALEAMAVVNDAEKISSNQLMDNTNEDIAKNEIQPESTQAVLKTEDITTEKMDEKESVDITNETQDPPESKHVQSDDSFVNQSSIQSLQDSTENSSPKMNLAETESCELNPEQVKGVDCEKLKDTEENVCEIHEVPSNTSTESMKNEIEDDTLIDKRQESESTILQGDIFPEDLVQTFHISETNDDSPQQGTSLDDIKKQDDPQEIHLDEKSPKKRVRFAVADSTDESLSLDETSTDEVQQKETTDESGDDVEEKIQIASMETQSKDSSDIVLSGNLSPTVENELEVVDLNDDMEKTNDYNESNEKKTESNQDLNEENELSTSLQPIMDITSQAEVLTEDSDVASESDEKGNVGDDVKQESSFEEVNCSDLEKSLEGELQMETDVCMISDSEIKDLKDHKISDILTDSDVDQMICTEKDVDVNGKDDKEQDNSIVMVTDEVSKQDQAFDIEMIDKSEAKISDSVNKQEDSENFLEVSSNTQSWGELSSTSSDVEGFEVVSKENIDKKIMAAEENVPQKLSTGEMSDLNLNNETDLVPTEKIPDAEEVKECTQLKEKEEDLLQTQTQPVAEKRGPRDDEVVEAVKKLKKRGRSHSKDRPHSSGDVDKSETKNVHEKSNPWRYYDWDTYHFYPDIHQLDQSGSYRNRFRRPSLDWIKDMETEQAKQQELAAMETNNITIETVSVSDSDNDEASEKENIRPKLLQLHTLKSKSLDDVRLHKGAKSSDMDYLKIPLDSDSDSDSPSSPRVWRKSPLHVRKTKRREERSLSGEIRYSETKSKRMHSSSPGGRKHDESSKSRRSPRRLSEPTGAGKRLSPRKQGSNSTTTVTRRNSDLQEKFQKFEELRERRKALESTSEESLPNAGITTHTQAIQQRLVIQRVDNAKNSRQKPPVQSDRKSEGNYHKSRKVRDRAAAFERGPQRFSDPGFRPKHNIDIDVLRQGRLIDNRTNWNLDRVTDAQLLELKEQNKMNDMSIEEMRKHLEKYHEFSSSFENIYDTVDLTMASPMNEIDYERWRKRQIEEKKQMMRDQGQQYTEEDVIRDFPELSANYAGGFPDQFDSLAEKNRLFPTSEEVPMSTSENYSEPGRQQHLHKKFPGSLSLDNEDNFESAVAELEKLEREAKESAHHETLTRARSKQNRTKPDQFDQLDEKIHANIGQDLFSKQNVDEVKMTPAEIRLLRMKEQYDLLNEEEKRKYQGRDFVPERQKSGHMFVEGGEIRLKRTKDQFDQLDEEETRRYNTEELSMQERELLAHKIRLGQMLQKPNKEVLEELQQQKKPDQFDRLSQQKQDRQMSKETYQKSEIRNTTVEYLKRQEKVHHSSQSDHSESDSNARGMYLKPRHPGKSFSSHSDQSESDTGSVRSGEYGKWRFVTGRPQGSDRLSSDEATKPRERTLSGDCHGDRYEYYIQEQKKRQTQAQRDLDKLSKSSKDSPKTSSLSDASLSPVGSGSDTWRRPRHETPMEIDSKIEPQHEKQSETLPPQHKSYREIPIQKEPSQRYIPTQEDLRNEESQKQSGTQYVEQSGIMPQKLQDGATLMQQNPQNSEDHKQQLQYNDERRRPYPYVTYGDVDESYFLKGSKPKKSKHDRNIPNRDTPSDQQKPELMDWQKEENIVPRKDERLQQEVEPTAQMPPSGKEHQHLPPDQYRHDSLQRQGGRPKQTYLTDGQTYIGTERKQTYLTDAPLHEMPSNSSKEPNQPLRTRKDSEGSSTTREKYDAKALIEEEKEKFKAYKKEYIRRTSQNDETPESPSSGTDKSRDIPPDDYEYVLRKVHHQRQKAIYLPDQTKGSDVSSGDEAFLKNRESPRSPGECKHVPGMLESPVDRDTLSRRSRFEQWETEQTDEYDTVQRYPNRKSFPTAPEKPPRALIKQDNQEKDYHHQGADIDRYPMIQKETAQVSHSQFTDPRREKSGTDKEGQWQYNDSYNDDKYKWEDMQPPTQEDRLHQSNIPHGKDRSSHQPNDRHPRETTPSMQKPVDDVREKPNGQVPVDLKVGSLPDLFFENSPKEYTERLEKFKRDRRSQEDREMHYSGGSSGSPSVKSPNAYLDGKSHYADINKIRQQKTVHRSKEDLLSPDREQFPYQRFQDDRYQDRPTENGGSHFSPIDQKNRDFLDKNLDSYPTVRSPYDNMRDMPYRHSSLPREKGPSKQHHLSQENFQYPRDVKKPVPQYRSEQDLLMPKQVHPQYRSNQELHTIPPSKPTMPSGDNIDQQKPQSKQTYLDDSIFPTVRKTYLDDLTLGESKKSNKMTYLDDSTLGKSKTNEEKTQKDSTNPEEWKSYRDRQAPNNFGSWPRGMESNSPQSQSLLSPSSEQYRPHQQENRKSFPMDSRYQQPLHGRPQGQFSPMRNSPSRYASPQPSGYGPMNQYSPSQQNGKAPQGQYGMQQPGGYSPKNQYGSQQPKGYSPNDQYGSQQPKGYSPNDQYGSQQPKGYSPNDKYGSQQPKGYSPNDQYGSPSQSENTPNKQYGSQQPKGYSPNDQYGSPSQSENTPNKQYGSQQPKGYSPNNQYGSPYDSGRPKYPEDSRDRFQEDDRNYPDQMRSVDNIIHRQRSDDLRSPPHSAPRDVNGIQFQKPVTAKTKAYRPDDSDSNAEDKLYPDQYSRLHEQKDNQKLQQQWKQYPDPASAQMGRGGPLRQQRHSPSPARQPLQEKPWPPNERVESKRGTDNRANLNLRLNQSAHSHHHPYQRPHDARHSTGSELSPTSPERATYKSTTTHQVATSRPVPHPTSHKQEPAREFRPYELRSRSKSEQDLRKQVRSHDYNSRDDTSRYRDSYHQKSESTFTRSDLYTMTKTEQKQFASEVERKLRNSFSDRFKSPPRDSDREESPMDIQHPSFGGYYPSREQVKPKKSSTRSQIEKPEHEMKRNERQEPVEKTVKTSITLEPMRKSLSQPQLHKSQASVPSSAPKKRFEVPKPEPEPEVQPKVDKFRTETKPSTYSKYNIADAKASSSDKDTDDIQVNIDNIKASLFGEGGEKQTMIALKKELEQVWDRKDRKVSRLSSVTYDKEDEKMVIPDQNSVFASSSHLDEDDFRISDYVSYKDGQKQRVSKIQDVLTGLEKEYEKLDLENPDILDGGDSRAPTYGNSNDPGVKRLSISNVKKLEDLMQARSDTASMHYAKQWLVTDKGSPRKNDPESQSTADTDEVFHAVKTEPSPESMEISHLNNDNQSVSAFSQSSDPRRSFGSRNSLPRRVSDDMAYRRANGSRAGSVKRDEQGSSMSVASYLVNSPGITPAPSCDSLARRAHSFRSKTPDPIFDDVVYRSLQRAKSPAHSETSSYTRDYTSTEYIFDRTTPCARARLRLKPDKVADKYHEDMAYRSLRKDIPPVQVQMPESYKRRRMEELMRKPRSKSLDRLQGGSEGGQVRRSKSLGPSGPKPSNLERRSSMSEAVARMVDRYSSGAQSDPEIDKDKDSSVFSVKYDAEGNLISDDPKYKHAVKPRKKETPRSIKQRHELKSKLRNLKHEEFEFIDAEPDNSENYSPRSPPEGAADVDNKSRSGKPDRPRSTTTLEIQPHVEASPVSVVGTDNTMTVEMFDPTQTHCDFKKSVFDQQKDGDNDANVKADVKVHDSGRNIEITLKPVKKPADFGIEDDQMVEDSKSPGSVLRISKDGAKMVNKENQQSILQDVPYTSSPKENLSALRTQFEPANISPVVETKNIQKSEMKVTSQPLRKSEETQQFSHKDIEMKMSSKSFSERSNENVIHQSPYETVSVSRTEERHLVREQSEHYYVKPVSMASNQSPSALKPRSDYKAEIEKQKAEEKSQRLKEFEERQLQKMKEFQKAQLQKKHEEVMRETSMHHQFSKKETTVEKNTFSQRTVDMSTRQYVHHQRFESDEISEMSGYDTDATDATLDVLMANQDHGITSELEFSDYDLDDSASSRDRSFHLPFARANQNSVKKAPPRENTAPAKSLEIPVHVQRVDEREPPSDGDAEVHTPDGNQNGKKPSFKQLLASFESKASPFMRSKPMQQDSDEEDGDGYSYHDKQSMKEDYTDENDPSFRGHREVTEESYYSSKSFKK